MTMEDKTFIVRVLALLIEIIGRDGLYKADDFRRCAIKQFGSDLYKDDVIKDS